MDARLVSVEEPAGCLLAVRAAPLRLPGRVPPAIAIAARRRIDTYLSYEAPAFSPADAGPELAYALAAPIADGFALVADSWACAMAAMDDYLPRAYIASLIDDVPCNPAQLAVNPADGRLAGWFFCDAATPVRLAAEYAASIERAAARLPTTAGTAPDAGRGRGPLWVTKRERREPA